MTKEQRGYIDWDWPEMLCGSLIVLLVVACVFGIREEMREQRAWLIWASEHACKVIGHMEGSTDTGIGPSTGGNGGVAVVTVTTPSKTGYQCDDGMTYWRNN